MPDCRGITKNKTACRNSGSGPQSRMGYCHCHKDQIGGAGMMTSDPLTQLQQRLAASKAQYNSIKEHADQVVHQLHAKQLECKVLNNVGQQLRQDADSLRLVVKQLEASLQSKADELVASQTQVVVANTAMQNTLQKVIVPSVVSCSRYCIHLAHGEIRQSGGVEALANPLAKEAGTPRSVLEYHGFVDGSIGVCQSVG